MKFALALALVLAAPAASTHASAQQSRVLATVPVSDVTASGVVEVSSGRSVLGNASNLATAARPAHITLLRGGEVELCQGSKAQLTGTGSGGKLPGIVVGLARGAMELHLTLQPTDAVMTPDLRIVAADGKAHPLDLALRVTRSGDTCVDNRGKKAPALNITDAFGTGTYQLKPGQRALFEHGSLHEVVDREQGPCGCPSSTGTSLAGGKGFPFPDAVSEGLADPSAPPPESSGITHTQVSTTLSADPATEPPPPGNPSTASLILPQPAPPFPEQKPGFFGAIGHFFKHLFVR